MSSTIDERKLAAARAAAALVSDGMVLGLGTGSTAALALAALAERQGSGLRFSGVPSSAATASLAERLGIRLTSLADHAELDLTIDGADEVDPSLDLIKGAGGALLREKVLAAASRQVIIIVDDTKLVARLGSRSALPVEVTPFALPAVARWLAELGLRPTPRRQGDQLSLTDNGNHIVDCATGEIADAAGLADQLCRLPGVVDHGLFLGLATGVVVGHRDGRVTHHRPGEAVPW